MAFDIFGYYLSVFSVTCLNSYFDLINMMFQGLDDKINFKINKACQKLNGPIFQQSDTAFF